MKKLFFLALLGAFSFSVAAQPAITDNSKLKFVEGDNTWLATALSFKSYMAAGGGTVTNFTAGTLSPLFTTSVATSTTTPALTFSLTNAAGNSYFGNATGSTGAPSFTLGGALSKVDDTNVTLTLGGSPANALLSAASLTLGWTGTLAVARGGTGLGTLGGDVTLLGSNGSANIYYSPTITNTAGAITYTRSGTNLVLNIPDADATNRGTVSTGTQSIAGAKTFTGSVTVTGATTGNGGVVGVATASVAAVNAAGVEDADFVVITANTTLDQTNNFIAVGTLTANITISLPACNSTRDGWEYQILKTGSDVFAAILDPNSTETFHDAAATKSIYSQGNGASCKCRSSNNTWFFKVN